MIRPSAGITHDAAVAILQARPMGIDTYQEPVVYMRADCPVCRSEGFVAQTRVCVSSNFGSVVATVNVVHGEFLGHGEAGLSQIAWKLLGADAPCSVALSHAAPVESFGHVRSKLFGEVLSSEMLEDIVRDISHRRYSDVQLSAFLAGCIGDRMTNNEVVALTHAMVAAGSRLDWGRSPVFDKHCVGGLPGNRTTPIVVAIVAACGLTIPKTSSRAITSPAGTADVMETLTRVDLSLSEIRRVVEQEGGCLVWGGAVALSPADDVLIRVERALDLDSDAQLVASVLSKKIAAGSTYAVIDIPVGPTAKVRDRATAIRLASLLQCTGSRLDLRVDTLISDGTQPVGRGIGPVLEAHDVLAVLRHEPGAPADLRERALVLAGRILELSGLAQQGFGTSCAADVIDDGRAWRKFQAICEAQGGLREPSLARHRYDMVAAKAGFIRSVDNRRLARVAKLAGAPNSPASGIQMHERVGSWVEPNTPVFTIHAEALGELDYALRYLENNTDLVQIDDDDEDAA